ncbi:hypothetical protein IPdc08_01571 [archaeon]|nr:hypothetical protein IPdc08_01571 [archaeon]
MFFLEYPGKLLFHSEICDFQSLVSDRELDIKKDKSLIRKLFARLQSSRTSRAEKIRQTV